MIRKFCVAVMISLLMGATSSWAAPQVLGPYVGDMRLIQDGERSIVVVISGGLEAAVAISEISSGSDPTTGHKTLSLRFAWAEGQSGHIRARLARRNARTADITNEPMVSESLLGKPYAWIVYDQETTPPDTSKLVATIRGPGNWDVAILDYVPMSEDSTDVDLEYLRQTDYAQWVAGRSWVPELLGPVGYREDSFND